jgi:hypothetical protein
MVSSGDRDSASSGDNGAPLQQRVTDLLATVCAAVGELAQKARDAVEGAAGRVGIGSSSDDEDSPAALPSGEKTATGSGPAAPIEVPAKTVPAKKTPAKRAAVKATPAKTEAANMAPVKKAPAKKAPAQKAPAKKAPAKKTAEPAKKAVEPTKSAAAKKTPAKKAPAKKAVKRPGNAT